MNKLVWWMTLCLAILTPITAVAGPVPGRRALRDATAELEEQKTAICKTAFARTEVLRARVAEIRDEIAAVDVPPPPKKPTAADKKKTEELFEEASESLNDLVDELASLEKEVDAAKKRSKPPVVEVKDADSLNSAKDLLQKRADDLLKEVPAAPGRQGDRGDEFKKAAEKAVSVGVCKDAEDCEKKVVALCSARKREWRAPAAAPAPAVRTAGVAVASGVSWQAAVTQGLADFMSARAQAELSLWLVERLRKDMCRDAKGFFPETCDLVCEDRSAAAPVSREYECTSTTGVPDGALFAAAVRADIEHLPARIAAKATGLDVRLFDALQDVLLRLRNGEPPQELLAGLQDRAELNALCDAKPASAPQAAADTSKVLACSLVATGYIAWNAKALIVAVQKGEEPDLAKLAGDIVKLVGTEQHVANAKAALTIDTARVKSFLEAVYALAKQIEHARQRSGESAMSAAIETIRLTVEVVDAGLDFAPGTEAQKTWQRIRGGFLAIHAIAQGKYADGVRELLSVINAYLKAVPASKETDETIKTVIGHVSFAVELSSAKTATEVQSALEGAAAPVGSWRGKRDRFTLSVTGLVGVGGGMEMPFSNAQGRSANAAFSPMGALGMDFSWGIQGTRSTVGAFISLLDVGQLLSLPILAQPHEAADGTSRAEAPNEAQLLQVVSPGAYLRFGLGDSPIVAGFGVAVAPQLRRYIRLDDGASIEDKQDELFTMFRAQAFVAVDLTLFPLYRSAGY